MNKTNKQPTPKKDYITEYNQLFKNKKYLTPQYYDNRSAK